MTTYYVCLGNAIDREGKMQDFTHKVEAEELRIDSEGGLLLMIGGGLRAVYKQYNWCLREDAMEAIKPSGVIPAKSVPKLVTN